MKLYIVGDATKIRENRLREEAEKRGHEVKLFAPYQSALHVSASGAHVIIGEEVDPQIDALCLVRLGKSWVDWKALLQLLEARGVQVFSPRKFHTSIADMTFGAELVQLQEQGLPLPETVRVRSAELLDAIKPTFSLPVIVKQSGTCGGEGVILAQTWEEVQTYLEETSKTGSVLIRAFIPNDGDIRVSVIDGKAVAAMHRIPEEGEFRSNIGQGATGKKIEIALEPELVRLAEAAVKLKGIDIAGVDIIRHKETGQLFLLEVNPNPSFDYMETFTKVNVAEEIVKMFERRVQGNRLSASASDTL